VKGDPSSSPTENTALFKTKKESTRKHGARMKGDPIPTGKTALLKNKTRQRRKGKQNKTQKIQKNKTKDERENRNRSRRERPPLPPVQFPQ